MAAVQIRMRLATRSSRSLGVNSRVSFSARRSAFTTCARFSDMMGAVRPCSASSFTLRTQISWRLARPRLLRTVLPYESRDGHLGAQRSVVLANLRRQRLGQAQLA